MSNVKKTTKPNPTAEENQAAIMAAVQKLTTFTCESILSRYCVAKKEVR